MHNITSPAAHDEAMEQRLAGSPAPRVSLADLEHNIGSVWYMTGDQMPVDDYQPPVPLRHPLCLLTICVVVTKSGFTVVGTSACASPENFDRQIGRELALADAKRQMWPLMGYALKNKLAGV